MGISGVQQNPPKVNSEAMGYLLLNKVASTDYLEVARVVLEISQHRLNKEIIFTTTDKCHSLIML
jgi:hypothetical protein